MLHDDKTTRRTLPKGSRLFDFMAEIAKECQEQTLFLISKSIFNRMLEEEPDVKARNENYYSWDVTFGDQPYSMELKFTEGEAYLIVYYANIPNYTCDHRTYGIKGKDNGKRSRLCIIIE